jgi:hypothetical protein
MDTSKYPQSCWGMLLVGPYCGSYGSLITSPARLRSYHVLRILPRKVTRIPRPMRSGRGDRKSPTYSGGTLDVFELRSETDFPSFY